MKRPNPFSTRFIRPGMIDYVESQASIPEMAQRIIQSRTDFQIVGPHGSGKTTCTIALANELKASGFSSRWLTLRQKSRFAMPTARSESYLPDKFSPTDNPDILFIDGIESLSYLQRRTMLSNQSQSGTKTVITTHRRRLGIPVLLKTESTLELFRNLASQLYVDDSPGWSQCVEMAYRNCNGDIREAFFVLYDKWQNLVTS